LFCGISRRLTSLHLGEIWPIYTTNGKISQKSPFVTRFSQLQRQFEPAKTLTLYEIAAGIMP
jgi:hypothetical protein